MKNILITLLFSLWAIGLIGQEAINLDQFNYGVNYQQRGEYENSINSFSMFIAGQPTYWRAYFYRGYSYLSMERYDKALGDFLKVTELNEKHEKGYFYAAKMHYQLGDYEEAITYFSKAIQRKPDFANAHNDKGMCAYQLGRYDEAVESFQEAIKIDKKFAMAYNNAGSARFYNQDIANPARRDLEDARNWFTKAIEQDDQLFIARYNRACMNYFLKNFDAALEDIEAAKLISPENPLVYFYLGIIHGKKENVGVALTNLEKAIELAPRLEYAYEEIANLYKIEENYAGAISNYQKALTLTDKPIYQGLMLYYKAKVYALQEDEYNMYAMLKLAKSKGVFKDLKVYQSFLKTKDFRKYRHENKFYKFTKAIRRSKKINRFTDSELAWFRMGK